MKNSAVAAGLVAILAGCTTHLEVRRDGSGPYAERGEDLRAGVDYGLPMLQYKLSVKRTLAACTDKAGAVDIRFLTKVTAEPHYVVGERYVINYPALSGWSKTSAFELQTYDTGAIKSLNAEAQDQTAGIIGDVVKTGIGLVSLSTGVPIPLQAAQLPPGTRTYKCSEATTKLLADIKSATADLKAKTKRLTEGNDEIGRLERLAGQNAMTNDAKKRLEEWNGKVRDYSKAVTAAQESLDALMDRVSASEELTWPRNVADTALNAGPNPASKKKLSALLDFTDQGPAGFSAIQLDEATALIGVLSPAGPAPTQSKCSPESINCEPQALKDKKAEGLVYRSPVPSYLLICQVPDGKACTPDGASSVIVSAGVLAPQLGSLRLLPMTNGAFQNNVLKVTFRENGGVATLNYDEKAARGKALSGTASSAVSQLLAFRDARQAFEDKKDAQAKADEAAKKKAVLDDLDNQIALLEKNKKLTELNTQAVKTSNTADVEAETAKLNAQIALLEAKRKLAEAEAALAKPIGP
ncbi:MAG: hypothetical protein KAY54_05410 [Burkholderiaceae bacterium]|nr:hypothetical protein [Burkholderiaceae bacterium]